MKITDLYDIEYLVETKRYYKDPVTGIEYYVVFHTEDGKMMMVFPFNHDLPAPVTVIDKRGE